MQNKTLTIYWALWLSLSVVAATALGYTLFEAEDKRQFMPGPLSPGHHQLADACDVCHKKGFGDREAMQETCIACHGDDRVKPFDSHPRAKFTDPRNADTLVQIDALHCVSCHTEHRPEITAKNGLTQPMDVCFHCHADIAKERPSHSGMAFDSCTNAGCHNFHNNRALYTDFLIKHMDASDHLERASVPSREFGQVLGEILDYPRDRYSVQPLKRKDADAPHTLIVDEQTMQDWLETRHAAVGVNCSACHQARDDEGNPGEWSDRPGTEGCRSCHALEIERFGRGKHGMRPASGLPPMQPIGARLPMHEDVARQDLTCNSCHPGHRYDTARAAVEACLDCHADKHSMAYTGSPHHMLWEKETAGESPDGSGVSCATCHMPRVDYDVNDWMSRKLVDHNQSATLSPNSKMMRPACLHCHGLPFSIDALADQGLIDNNFNGRPGVHVESIDLARAVQERYLREMAGAAR